MFLHHPANLGCFISSRPEAVYFGHGRIPVKKSGTDILLYDESKERIKKMFEKVELSVSSYDTAWMAMVPSSSVSPLQSQTTPQFPSCLNWILNNQLSDGSWGLCDRDTTLTMDALSSTLACVLALKQWGAGERQINLGLEFIATYSAFVNDDTQRKPIGFDIIFPGMIERAKSLNLNVPVRRADLDSLLQMRNLELARSSVDRRAYLSYISEAMGISQDWQMAMKYQRKNGSLFNSPSATAAAFSHLHNAECLQYLNLLLDRFGDAVPAVYPLAIYTRLWMVDSLERLGIHHHFKVDIEIVLEETYRWWMQGEEEIFQDTTTCAMAFRILRLHGYDVSSDALRQYVDEDHFQNTLEGYLAETGPVLELYKSSQIIIYQDEVILEEINSWTRHLLIGCRKHANEGLLDKHLRKEVDHALRYPYHADVEGFAKRRNIEHYSNLDSTRILKSAVRSSTIGNKDFLSLAVEDFNKYQLIYQKELKDLERWIVEQRLDKLEFARHKMAYCFLAAATTMPTPELSDARISCAKNAVMTIYIDDLYDVAESEEEQDNFSQLIKKYLGDADISTECYSENVEILCSALDSVIREMGDKSFAWQGRKVTSHIIEIWSDFLKSMVVESEWSRKKSAPKMDDYVANGFVSIALGPIVVITLYFMGPQLSENAAKSSEMENLLELMSTCGRLLNDVQGFKRESAQGKLNAVPLQMIHSGADVEEAIQTIKGIISSNRRELLRCVLEGKLGNCVIPSPCRDLFWKMCTILSFFYLAEDGLTMHTLMDTVKTFFYRQICVDDELNIITGERTTQSSELA